MLFWMSQNVVMIKNLEQIDEKFSEKLYRENLFFKKSKAEYTKYTVGVSE